ncbi:tRNA (adenosine(37)-N6)-dimethylallyltransferase MiaA [Rubrivirga sp. SAORIC476]|nr:tRNA (adenosine(37)-N6)-dimethylallyltransferase MiaA [Rubrivirga sp. SAORIC476]
MERHVVSPLLIIAGPTGVGKSSLAHEVAGIVGAEILSADSRQVYRGMTIGTAKASDDEREQHPYHLVDILAPGVRWSAGGFLEVAQKAIADIEQRQHPVVVAGGSTLYVHALLEGLADLPAVSPSLEAQLLEEVAQPDGAERLYEELRTADPVAADTLDPSKTHRLIRFVGLWRETGRRPSTAWEGVAPPHPAILVVLTRPRDELYRRIDARVLDMIEAGLMDEVQSILEASPHARPTLEATIGYRELLPVLDGERHLDEAIRLIQRNSRRYAKRQLTWYRRYPEARWVDASATTAASLLAELAPWPAG